LLRTILSGRRRIRPEKFNDDFEESPRDTESTLESNLDFSTSAAYSSNNVFEFLLALVQIQTTVRPIRKNRVRYQLSFLEPVACRIARPYGFLVTSSPRPTATARSSSAPRLSTRNMSFSFSPPPLPRKTWRFS